MKFISLKKNVWCHMYWMSTLKENTDLFLITQNFKHFNDLNITIKPYIYGLKYGKFLFFEF